MRGHERCSAPRNVRACRIPGGRWAAAFPWAALLCGNLFIVPAVTPAAGHGGEVTGGNLDQDDPDAVGSSIHISIAPRGSATGSRTIGTPAAASRACSA